MSKLTLITKNNNHQCETCGRTTETPIILTNQTTTPHQTYSACPFCFTKLQILEEPETLNSPTIENLPTMLNKNTETEQTKCPHYLGYLKKRPKNMAIPETCLTCEKMIKCVL